MALKHGMNSLEERSRKRSETLSRLIQHTLCHPEGTFLISSEHLHSRLTNEEEIESLARFLSPLFDSVTIVLYIRKPIDTAISAWSTGVKCGLTGTSLPSPSNPYIHNLCMHKESILRWSNYFGESNLCVRLFRRDALFKNDLIHDFVESCGIGFSSDMIIPPKTNEKLGLDGILFLAEVNKVLPLIIDNKPNPVRGNIANYFSKHFSDSPAYIPSEDEVLSYSSYYNHSDLWVKDNYFGHLDSLWGEESRFPMVQAKNDNLIWDADIKSDSRLGYSPESVSRLLTLLSQVWVDKSHRIISLESENLRLMDELSQLKKSIILDEQD
ncbi:hypothetical protein H8F25_00585 [Synechococcus sp. CBW1004]|nr:hypothetical protein H8F25_00585 [Synechococcus sp. CBW1004]